MLDMEESDLSPSLYPKKKESEGVGDGESLRIAYEDRIKSYSTRSISRAAQQPAK
jgi:hypothetical protein